MVLHHSLWGAFYGSTPPLTFTLSPQVVHVPTDREKLWGQSRWVSSQLQSRAGSSCET